ncbi:MAG: PEP-CTERM sorting domain-containing protein [Verrucomicrobiaceae bacterium]|nr:PEP-CTERM sorting domain-containing protein [Verrucomicrobiaceae bacterium]
MVAAIPEPGTALLIAMLATAWGQRRQRNKNLLRLLNLTRSTKS